MKSRSLGPVMLDVAGVELQPEESDILAHPQVGGVILFSRNYEDPQQLDGLVRTMREARADLVVATDHEGGRVQRFRQGFTRIPAMQRVGDAYDDNPSAGLHVATELGWLLAVELLAHKVDMSFAPVLDVDATLSDVIGDRAFSAEPDNVEKLAGAFISGMHDAGMAVTGKHFPGHGGVKADSHVALPVDPRDLETLNARDTLPFSQLIDQLDAVMSAHILFPEIDDELVSFSPFWLKHYLRDTLGFDGLVFSDDLSMAGAEKGGSYCERAQRALNAGCDVVLACNQPKQAIAVIEELEGVAAYRQPSGLEKMAMRTSWTREQLHASDRWQSARDIAEEM